jgi:sulfur-oxidizing protein SoxY
MILPLDTTHSDHTHITTGFSRRRWLTSLGSVFAVSLVPVATALAADPLQEVLQRTFGATPLQQGGVSLSLPALAENGNSVRLSVAVDSPMSAEDYVRFIQLFAPANPLPDIVRFELSPLSGTAAVETRVRLAAEQDVVAVAGLSDGTLWTGAAHIVVTEAACLEALI